MSAARVHWILGLGWAAGMLGATVLSQSCVIDDPEHCHHNAGDGDCADGLYCDRCVSSEVNGGCVEDVPDETCRSGAGMAPTSGGSGETIGGPTGGETDTAPPTSCSGEGRDANCPPASPFCVDETCTPCEDAGGDAYCVAQDGATALCGGLGDCVECTVDDASACGGATALCDPTGTCVGCFKHSHCMTGENEGPGCDLWNGECLPESLVYYVGLPACIGGNGGFGNQVEPWCDLDNAQDVVDGLAEQPNAGVTIHFTSGSYAQSISASNGVTLVLIGADGTELNAETGVSDSATLYTHNLKLSGGSGDAAALSCSTDGRLWVRETQIAGTQDGPGVQAASGCEITIDRSVIASNAGGGIDATGSTVLVHSAALMYNGVFGIRASAGTVDANHATIIQNGIEDQGSNVMCSDAADVVIRNSVVMHDLEQSFAACGGFTVRNSVVDSAGLLSEDDGVIYEQYSDAYFQSPMTEDDPHVLGDAPFADVARRESGPPYFDIDSEAHDLRPGVASWAGADQP